MKRFKVIALFLTLMARLAAADEFWQHLTPDERAAAGLEQLTPEQRAVLDKLAIRYAKEGVRRAVEVAKEKAKEEGRAEARAAAQEKKKASIGLAPREDDETEVVRTHIQGDFHGWTGHTDFVLENGHRWQQVDSDQRFFPKMVEPEEELLHSLVDGWSMSLL